MTKPSTREEQIKSSIAIDLDERAAQIWAWVRENRNSLDSGRGRRLIVGALQAATESVCIQVAPLLLEIDELKEKIVEMRAKAKAEIAEVEAAGKADRVKLAALRKEVAELREQAVVVN